MLGNNHQMISLQMYRNFASKILVLEKILLLLLSYYGLLK